VQNRFGDQEAPVFQSLSSSRQRVLRPSAVGHTHPGLRRENNEDSFAVYPNLCVVADGMGGHAAGEVASKLAVDTVTEVLQDSGTTWTSPRLPSQLARASLVLAIEQANERVFAASQQREALRGMGTTLVAVLAFGQALAVAHVGDSRAYLFRSRRLERLTDDHTLANACRGAHNARELAHLAGCMHALTRAIGTEATVEVDARFVAPQANDVLLLCSDGLTNAVNEHDIANILREHTDLDDAAAKLIACANDNGGPDNVTVVLQRWLESA
jgi:serine/threonine protein phosphatase PrpC